MIETLTVSGLRPGEVLVRVVACGLCHSDLHFASGDRACPLPALLGHEVSGVVEAVGDDVRGLKAGDAVIASVPSCGSCRECRSSNPQRCDHRPTRPAPPRLTLRGEPVFQFVEVGGFAEMVLVDQRGVALAPEGVPLDLAALFGCAVISGYGAVTRCAQVRPGQSVAVIGCGGVGLNIVQAARIAGAERIFAIDLSQDKLELAARLGATDLILAGPHAAEQVIDATDGGVDYAFEAVGLAQTISQALSMLRKGGGLVLVGIPRAGLEVPLPVDLMFRKELRVLSTISGSLPLHAAVDQLGRHYREGQLSLAPLVGRRIRLDEVNDGLAALRRGEVVRSLIIFDDHA